MRADGAAGGAPERDPATPVFPSPLGIGRSLLSRAPPGEIPCCNKLGPGRAEGVSEIMNLAGGTRAARRGMDLELKGPLCGGCGETLTRPRDGPGNDAGPQDDSMMDFETEPENTTRQNVNRDPGICLAHGRNLVIAPHIQ